jgi:hypothetical protein
MRNNDVGIYYDSDTSQYHLSQLKNLDPLTNCTCTNDLDDFLRFVTKTKLAVLHIPYPFDTKFEELIQKVNADHIYVIGSELHPPIVNFILRNDNPKITYFLCGFLNQTLKHSQVYQFMDWFETTTYFYKSWLPEILTRLDPYSVKYRYFDILLGRKKLHRDELYNRAVSDPSIGIMTYFNDHNTKLGNDPGQWIWEHTGVKTTKQLEWTVDRVEYFGCPISISQIIPINVYNQTAYSVIAETCFQDDFAFFTEKTAKPIIARRLFIMFAGQGYLANLRKLGFQTFGDIIDESYDNESDALIRWDMAFQQMQWLAKQPQEEILDKIKPIVEHNFEVIMSTNWYKKFSNQLEQDVARIIGDLPNS